MRQQYREVMDIEALSKVNRIRKLQRAAPIGKQSAPLTEAEKVAKWTQQVKGMPEIRLEVIQKESSTSLMDLAAKLSREL
jgi:hypothetical protein